MKVRIDRTFAVPGPAAAAWALLQDLEGVAACMPGATITERIDERRCKGTVAVRLGPVGLTFRGEVQVSEIDAAACTLRLAGKGTDTTGGSGAALDLTARVEAVDAASCSLVGSSEVSVSGKAAAFGGRMLDSVADQVLKQFAANFAARVQALQAQAQAQAAGDAAEPAPVEPAKPLDGLALLWAAIKAWLCSLRPARRS